MSKKVSHVEKIKEKSNYLRGTLEESLRDEITGAIADDDTQLIKFHGSYQQADRDLDSERKRQKLEPLYSFMIRVRAPGGIVTAEQWRRLDDLADEYGNSGLKLTTRQAVQLHGILKKDLRPTIQGFNEVLMDSFAGCGDVNRNVMCNPNPYLSPIHEEVFETAGKISDYFTPKTSSYHEIWLDGKKIKSIDVVDDEPIYGKTYLPRKFKIAIAIPPHNDVDIYANDIGIIAIEKNGKLKGYNIAIGGGMGMTFGRPDTYPRLADDIGFVKPEKLIDVIGAIMMIQRDHGNREDRKLARMKYTIDKMGLNNFKKEIEKRVGFNFLPQEKYHFENNGDQYGWNKNLDGTHNITLFVEGGRVKNTEQYKLKEALRKIADVHPGDFRLTGNQNLMICRIPEKEKPIINGILAKYKVLPEQEKSGLRLNSIACVALNTCTLAMAESERYLPSLIDKLDQVLIKNNLEKDEIIIRMTGCPNGCGRPYLGEIGFVGRAIGLYNLYLGASFNGDRLNKLYKEMVDEKTILETLEPIIADYAKNRNKNERFGDFVIRKEYVLATTHGTNFYDN
ncbi:MAG: NADPH-dependent assimilatory sulfite reductase hemoprotein subunit [Bacteroidota bacterium]